MGRTSCNGPEAEMDGLIDVICTIYPLFDHIFKPARGVFWRETSLNRSYIYTLGYPLVWNFRTFQVILCVVKKPEQLLQVEWCIKRKIKPKEY